jgi:pyrroloquinoline quinone biosynthesis protein D
VNSNPPIRRPTLVRHARYRWDKVRGQHQVVYPEGLLVLNESGAAIVRLCDGRSLEELLSALEAQFSGEQQPAEVEEFLQQLANKGLLHDARDA